MKLKKEFTKAEILSGLRNFSLVVLGNLILAFGCAVFILPFDLVTGGINGLSIVIDHITGGALPIDILIAALTWGVFFLGLIFLGKDFALKTLVSSIVFPPALSIFMKLVESEAFGGLFNLQNSEYASIAIIVSALFAGVCIGTGCAVTFIGGGSTGGLDIIALIFCKYFKRLKSSVAVFALDGLTVLLGMFVLGDLIKTLLGIIAAFVTAMVIDRVFGGRGKSFTAQIISEKPEELNVAIREEMKRTTTILDVIGGYSGEHKRMLMVTFTMPQYATLISVINKVDKKAFVSIHSAHEINGEGWTYGEHD